MKKIFTLVSVLLVTVVSFAAGIAPSSRLTVTATSNANVRIVIDESKYSQQISDASFATFEGLAPGYHTVKVYEMVPQRRGFFGKKQSMRLLYTSTVNIKPMTQLNISLNRNGRAQIDEQVIRGGRYDNKGWDNGRGNDRYDRNKNSFPHDNRF